MWNQNRYDGLSYQSIFWKASNNLETTIGFSHAPPQCVQTALMKHFRCLINAHGSRIALLNIECLYQLTTTEAMQNNLIGLYFRLSGRHFGIKRYFVPVVHRDEIPYNEIVYEDHRLWSSLIILFQTLFGATYHVLILAHILRHYVFSKAVSSSAWWS